MSLIRFQCTDFRCIERADLELSRGYNLVIGENASGKTSVLEAIAYLGRGRSFRGATTRELIRHGQESFVLHGTVDNGHRRVSIGVGNSREGLEVHIDAEKQAGAAPLAENLPLLVIDPDVHNLVAGGPDDRRRYLDWVAFHVEHGFLEGWRRFRRALRQRNAALKQTNTDLSSWNVEVAEAGEAIDAARQRVLEILEPALAEAGEALLASDIDVQYQQGWPAEHSLAEALVAGEERDRQQGSTQAGPHRADLRLNYDERRARKLVSRGQQKLLASAMILAAAEVVQSHLEKPLLLLLDDPAAELDSRALSRLMSGVVGLGCQVVATALEAERPLFPSPPATFHVEHGSIQPDA